MGRTRLWQATGSPIIQGQSRHRAPYWSDLLGAVAVSGVIAGVYDAVVSKPYALAWSELAEFAAAFAIGAGVALIPSAVTVMIARNAAARKPRLVGAIIGTLFAVGYLGFGWKVLS